MPKSRAEIQRDYRRRRDADPERREHYLQKEHLKYRRDMSTGKRKLVSNLSEREIRRQRRQWKSRQRRSRAERKRQLQNTPPRTPEEHGCHNSRQKERGRKCMRRDQKAAYRRIAELECELVVEKRKAEKYKKRHQRLLAKPCCIAPETPRTKTRRLLASFHRYKSQVTKTLTFHYALIDTIKNRYRETTSERQKQAFTRLVTGRIIRKYRMETFTREHLGFSTRRWLKRECNLTAEEIFRKKRPARRNCALQETVLKFYTRDDVSRMTAGKKETITKQKCKMQKRLLVDNLLNSHLKFTSEFPNYHVSYSLFCRLRPFWVVAPTSQDRQTCLCKTHNNLELIIDKLVELKVFRRVYTVDRLCDSIVCDPKEKKCMYGECAVCAVSCLDFCCDCCASDNDLCVCASELPKMRHFNKDTIVSFYSWKNKIVEADGKKSSIVVKELETVELTDLVDRLNSLLCKARKHVYNIRHQYASYRSLRSALDEHSCLIHIDFSENYQCQFHDEIQAVHFGGSHQQTILHTGVLYVSQKEPLSFCTVSDSHRKDPVAIWAHLDPLLKKVRSDYATVTRVHFFSDGPTTQYRQKKNFFLFSSHLFNYGFELGTWNFFEASHGKGAADGVGAVVKRTADRLVNQGIDLPTPMDVYNHVSPATSIHLFYVDAQAVKEADEIFNALAPQDLPLLPGTMSVHQLYACKCNPGSLTYRDVSCFCSICDGMCNCFETKTFKFSLISSTSNTSSYKDDVSGSEIANVGTLTPVDSASAADLIGRFCVVRYDNKPYPGRILEVCEADVTVECMHHIGGKGDSNRFFWPQKIKDICEYTFENVLSLIPEPQRIGDHGRTYSHFRVLPEIWTKVEQIC